MHVYMHMYMYLVLYLVKALKNASGDILGAASAQFWYDNSMSLTSLWNMSTEGS